MSDLNPLFATLEDVAGNGVALTQKVVGDDTTGNGAMVFAFQDDQGNVVLPQLTADGRIPTAAEATGTCLSESGALAAGSTGAFATVTGAELTLTLEKEYSAISLIFAATVPTVGQIVAVDDASGTPVETVLGEVIVGPGQYTIDLELKCLIHSTVGGTGDQKLIVKGQNLTTASCIRATIAALEAA